MTTKITNLCREMWGCDFVKLKADHWVVIYERTANSGPREPTRDDPQTETGEIYTYELRPEDFKARPDLLSMPFVSTLELRGISTTIGSWTDNEQKAQVHRMLLSAVRSWPHIERHHDPKKKKGE